MDDTNIDTGSEELDRDLRVFFEVCEGDQLERVNQGIANDSLSEEEFSELVPDAALTVAFMLSSPFQYLQLLDEVPKEARPTLEEAKRRFDRRFCTILKHPLPRERLQKALESAARKPERLSPLVDSLNVISKSEHFSLWVGNPPKLTPALRIAFSNPDDKLLLDTTVDWEDLLFLLDGLMKSLADQFDEAQKLAKAEQLDLDDMSKLGIGKRIANIEKHLQEIKRLAPTYGIDVAPSEPGESEEPTLDD